MKTEDIVYKSLKPNLFIKIFGSIVKFIMDKKIPRKK